VNKKALGTLGVSWMNLLILVALISTTLFPTNLAAEAVMALEL